MLVREIRREDYEAIESIARALSPKWFTDSAVQEIVHAVRNERGFVAISNSRSLGFATCRERSDGVTADLTWIGVHPDFHRRGVGRSLIEAVELEFGKRGFKALEVCTVAGTVDYEPYALTRKFYSAMGFAEMEIVPGGFPSGDDKLLLTKHIVGVR